MATVTSTRPYRLDFRQRHTTATGMVNAVLSTITVATVSRAAVATSLASIGEVRLAIAGLTSIGVMSTLMWGAFARQRPTSFRVGQRLICWIGSMIWCMLLLAQEWTFRTITIYVATLVSTAAMIGFVGWLRSPLTVDQIEIDPAEAEAERQQMIRDSLGAEWEDRFQRVLGLEVKIPGIRNFDKISKETGQPIGYTMQVEISAGGASWQTVKSGAHRLANDAKLPSGCDVTVRMGEHRRMALVDVTVVDCLGEEQLYPTDYSPLSVKGMLPMMVTRRGEVNGPTIREQNVLICGEGGSGKSNAGQVLGAGVARMVDALLCDIDVTGRRLSMPLLRPFLDGRAENPAVFWCAYDEDEALLLLRAMQRAAIARNNGYDRLKVAAGDDKMPVSNQYPAFILRCDEITHIASNGANPALYQLIRNMVNDHRDPAIRVIMLGLRGTNDIITQALQAQMHNIGALRAQKSELSSIFGSGAAHIQPEDAPYPGCINMRLGSGAPIQPYKVWRLVGNQLDDIGVAVDAYQPRVDALTWLALNGRDATGQPMPDLLPNELDCCKTRWDRFRAQFGSGSSPVVRPVPAIRPARTPEQTEQMLDDAQTRLARKVEAARASQSETDQIESTVDGFLVDLFGSSALVTTDEPTYQKERLVVAPSPQDLIYQMICDAGDEGIAASAILRGLADGGLVVDRATVYKWLNAMSMPGGSHAGRIERRSDRDGSRNGRWFKI